MKLGGSGSFRVSGGIVGHLGFRVGVSASYSYFRRVRNFDFVYTATVSVPLAIKETVQYPGRLHDGMPNGGMPKGENDVVWAECRTPLGAMPNGRSAERAQCRTTKRRKLNSTKHMLCVTFTLS